MAQVLMKRGILFLSILLLFFTSTSGLSLGEKSTRFIFHLSGGWTYIHLHDWNAFLASSNRMQQDLANLFRYDIRGKFPSIHEGLEVEGGFQLRISPTIKVFLTLGFFSQNQDAEKSKIFIHRPLFSEVMTHSIKIHILPIKLGASYSLKTHYVWKVFFETGLAFYLGRLSDNYRHEMDGYWEETAQEARGSAVGIFGGISTEYMISSSLSLLLKAEARMANITHLRGKFNYNNSSAWRDYYEGNLYYYEMNLAWTGLGSYSFIKILPEQPSSPTFQNVRRATLDLSGFSFRAGLNWRF